MHLAIFGDIHGRVPLMFALARAWEQHSGHALSGILQVGDMGAYPDLRNMEPRVARAAKDDPDMLGFQELLQATDEPALWLEDLQLPACGWIRGNQEDFAYLDGFSRLSAVDPHRRLWYLPDGHTLSIAPTRPNTRDRRTLISPSPGPHGSICVGGFGGIPVGTGPRRKQTASRKAKQPTAPYHFTKEQIEAAFVGLSQMNVDVLLTHEGPQCRHMEGGSIHIAHLAERLRPSYHFFGHHYFVTGPCEGPGGAVLVGFDHLFFNQQGTLNEGAWGILSWQQESTDFTMATRHTMPWLTDITPHSFRSYLPSQG